MERIESRAVFEKRRKWRKLPEALLDALASRFESPSEAKAFIRIAQRSGMYKKRIRHLIGESITDVTFVIEMLAAMLTSYANGLGERGDIDQARKCLVLALRLNPNHVPAWSSMAITAINSGDCPEAVRWAEKFLAFEVEAGSDPELREAAAARAMSATGEQEAAIALGDPSILGAWDRTRQTMREIIGMCGE